MPDYDVTLSFTLEAEDRADADEIAGGIMSYIIDETGCGAVGGQMVEAELRQRLAECEGRPTTPESALALEAATLPDPEPRDPELYADDGFDI